MPLPVCTVGHRFIGYCQTCNREVGGVMVTGEPQRTIDGMCICVTGSIGVGDCGHQCRSIGQSVVWDIDGKPVVRIGDMVTDGIEGILVTGSDYVRSD